MIIDLHERLRTRTCNDDLLLKLQACFYLMNLTSGNDLNNVQLVVKRLRKFFKKKFSGEKTLVMGKMILKFKMSLYAF